MSAILARKMWRTLEPYHGLIYFTPRASEAYAALGVRGQDGYFASRAAALGPVPAEVVIATFYNFEPGLVRRAIPAAWDAAPPAAFVDARLGAADLALRDVLGDEAIGSSELRDADPRRPRDAGGGRPAAGARPARAPRRGVVRGGGRARRGGGALPPAGRGPDRRA